MDIQTTTTYNNVTFRDVIGIILLIENKRPFTCDKTKRTVNPKGVDCLECEYRNSCQDFITNKKIGAVYKDVFGNDVLQASLSINKIFEKIERIKDKQKKLSEFITSVKNETKGLPDDFWNMYEWAEEYIDTHDEIFRGSGYDHLPVKDEIYSFFSSSYNELKMKESYIKRWNFFEDAAYVNYDVKSVDKKLTSALSFIKDNLNMKDINQKNLFKLLDIIFQPLMEKLKLMKTVIISDNLNKKIDNIYNYLFHLHFEGDDAFQDSEEVTTFLGILDEALSIIMCSMRITTNLEGKSVFYITGNMNFFTDY